MFQLLRNTSSILLCLLVFFLLGGHVAAAESQSPTDSSEVTVVKVGVWLIDIDSIDSASQGFVANLFLRLRWQNPELAHGDEDARIYDIDDIRFPTVNIANEIGRVRKTLPEVVRVGQDGSVTYVQRYVGTFSQALKLHDFPFDEHRFRLHFILASKFSQDVEFVADDELIRQGLRDAGGISDEISLPDWSIESYSASPQPYMFSQNLSAPGYAFDFVASRDSRYYIYKVITPLALIVLMSWAVFWINPKEAGTQVGVSTASILTLIAYRFMADQLVPRVSYMTRLDEFIFGSTLLVFLSMIQVIVTSTLMREGKETLSLQIDRFSRYSFPVVFFALTFIAFK